MKVLAYTSPARGHLFPLVGVLDELQRRGHAIALRTLASEVQLMRERGFDTAAISPRIEALVHDDYLARNPPGRVKRALAVLAARAELEVADVRAAIEAEAPDALLIDAMSWGASAIADGRAGPWGAVVSLAAAAAAALARCAAVRPRAEARDRPARAHA
jgi:UDP:flavonoid glycosyltransferase YjiC (YdhE family)